MDSHILKFGDLVIIQGAIQPNQNGNQSHRNYKKSQSNVDSDSLSGNSGFLSAMGFTDNRVFLQSVAPNSTDPLKTASTWNNYTDMVFQVWPKLSYEAHKQHKKLKAEERLVKESHDDGVKEAFEEKLKKMCNRVEDERESNKKQLSTVIGLPVLYGTDIQIMHINSQSFLTAKVACSDSDKSAYKFELFNEANSGMTFKLLPKFKIRQEGEPIQLEDQVLIYSNKLDCYVNFTNDKVIEMDKPLQMYAKARITAPYELRELSGNTQRYEAHVSQFKDCTWKFFYYGSNIEPGQTIVRGGDLITIRHTEIESLLAADSHSYTKNFKVYGRSYHGEYEEEENSVNTIWEVESEESTVRGDQCLYKDEQGKQNVFRLRHFITGKLLCIQTEETRDGHKPLLMLAGSEYDKREAPSITFKSFANNAPPELRYGTAYSIGITDDKGAFRYLTALEREDYSQKRRKDSATPKAAANNANNTVFKPLSESEFSTKKRAIMCEQFEPDAEHAFLLAKVESEEESHLRYVASAIATLRYFSNLVKTHKNAHEFNPNILTKTLGVLKDLIFFVHKVDGKTAEIADPITFDGITVASKQRLLKDFRVIEILTEILYHPFEMYFFTLNNIDSISFKLIFQCCYRLIKHVIKEYRPNEIYASQWLEFYMDQAMRSDAQNDIKAEATLIELIDNNKKILNTKIDREIIMKFVQMLKENRNQKYVNLLRALCVCDGEAVVKNQTDMSRFIIEDVDTRNHLIFQNFRKNGLNQLEIRLPDYEGVSGEFWTTISGFQNISSERDENEKYEYFLSMIYLLSDLCLQRNYVAINFLKHVYTYDLCFSTISDDNLSWELRTAFAKLLNTLWLDKNPYQPLNVPQYLITWDDLTPEKCQEITSAELDHVHATRFDSLKEYLRNYYTKLAKEGCTKIYEEERNKFTAVMLELSINMVKFGLYKSVDRLKELTRPLLILLNGMKDVMTPSEYEQFKKQLNGPPRKTRKRPTIGVPALIGDGEARNTERYIEAENTMIVMNCKNQICELLTIVMDIDDDLCLRKFLLEFKKEHEIRSNREFDLSEGYKGSGDKKSLFGNYRLFRGNDDDNDNTDYIKTAIDWIKNILETDPLELGKLAPTNFVKILFDLSLYEHEDLVNHSFELLYKAHSRRPRLKEMLEEVQIMEDQDRKLAIKTIEGEIKALKELAETTENWYGNTDEDSREKTKECVQLLRKLTNYLSSENVLGKVQNPEPDAEIITSPPKNLPAGFQFDDEELGDEMNVDPEFQLILRHLKAIDPMMEMLEFEVANTEDEKNEEKRTVLKEVIRFLARFVHHQKYNQNLMMEHLPLFMKIMKNYSNCGVETLLEELFKGNKTLVKQTHQVEKFTKNIITMIKANKTSDHKSSKLLSSLQVLMKHKKQAIKPNQTIILTLLTSKENDDIFMSLEDKADQKHIERLIQEYNQNIQQLETNSLIDFPGELDYLSTILEVVAVTCEGKNAVTESRSQTTWTLNDLAFLYERAGQCWLLKRNILFFFYHVYLDTEREMKEEVEPFNKIFLGIIEDMKSIQESYKSTYEIKYHKGIIDNKQAMDILYYEGILPCITDIISKRFYIDLPDYSKGLTSMLQLIRQRENTVVSRTYLKLIRGTIGKFKVHTREIYASVTQAAPLSPSEFPETFTGIISGNTSPTKRVNASVVREDNAKTLKLRMRLSMMDQTEAFGEYAEEEFESMVTTLIGIEKLAEDHYSSFLPFNDVIKSLIALVDITEGTLDKDMIIIGLKMFRKIIERENKLSHECAAEWESEQWMKFEKKVVQRQSQLCSLGLVDMICHTVSHAKDIEIQHESFLVGIALLIGGNAEVQAALLEYMQNDTQNNFLLSIKKLLDKNFETMKKEMSLKNKEYADQLLEKEEQVLRKMKTFIPPPSYATTPKAGGPLSFAQTSAEFGAPSSKEFEIEDDIGGGRKLDDVEEAKQALVVLERAYRFLQLFCEGHNLDMQNQLRVQKNPDGIVNGKSHDFITQTAYHFNALIKQVNVDCLDVGVQMLDFLIEALQGPCEGNQLALSKAKIINSCMDFLTMFVKDIDYKKLGFLEPEQVASANDGTTTAMKLLNALIEGVSYPEIIEEMSSLDLRFLIKKITLEYESFVGEKLKMNIETAKPEQVTKRLGADSFDQPLLESFDVYILLANLADHSKAVASFLKDTDEFTYREKNALKFFKVNVNNIEILFKDKLLKVYYPYYPVCRNLSRNSRKNLMTNVSRESATEKINGLVSAAPDLFDEMNHTATLKDQVFFFSQKKYNAIRDFSTLISLIINIIIIAGYTTVVTDGDSTRMISDEVIITINVLGYIQIVTSSTMILFWIILHGPVILRRRWREYVHNNKAKLKEDDFDILANLEEDYDIEALPLNIVMEILARKGPYDPVFNPDGQRNYGHLFIRLACYWRNVTFIFTEGKFIFMAFYLVVSALGVYTEITYCLHLLDVINRSDVLRNVVKAVTYNLKQLLATALLGVIMIYIYSILAFFFVDDSYFNADINGNGERQCASMLQCYMTTLNWGLRNGGGIGDTLLVESYAADNKGRYFFRLIFDLSFFLIINIVFLNIIFGIIIDTFAELRDQKNAMDEDMKTICYICNLDRYTFDKNGTGFENHIEKQHHLWNYVFFIYSVNAKDPTEYNGIESYVQEKLQAEDNSWFPLHKAIELGPDHEAPEDD